jgi:hypothetical protein
MSTTSETELRAEIAWLEARNREVNLQRIEAETLARSQAARLDELERENAALHDKLEHLLSIDKQHDRTPRIIDLCYTAFMRAHAKNDEDGGPTDWFTDTYPMIVKAIERHRAAALAGSGEK